MASPSASPPPVISDALSLSLSLNSRVQLLPSSGDGVWSPFHPAGGGCYGNVPASPSSSSSLPRFAPLDAGRALAPAGAQGSVDRRKMRMLKNLESATRSRARKKAHVTLIETEVVELREANQQLRLQYDQLKAKVESLVFVKKTLQRVLSAPF
ncbi:unnamed protein product [Alopecurus aequalis]